MQNRLSYSSQTPILPNFHLFSQNFALLLASYFSKKIAGKIDAALQVSIIKSRWYAVSLSRSLSLQLPGVAPIIFAAL